MLCRDVIKKLSDYIDGELDPTLVRDLAGHLEHCEDCRIIVDTTRKTIEIYCNAQPAALPDDVRRRLDRALARKLGRSSL